MKDRGFVIFERYLCRSLIENMTGDLEEASIECGDFQKKNGITNSENTVHHIISNPKWKSFIDFLNYFGMLSLYMETYFDGKFILNSFGGNILRNGASYANNIHRDQRNFSGVLPLMLNTIVMLDDFTTDNGATWLMWGGHTEKNRPSEKQFYGGDNWTSRAIQATAPSGSIIMFNSNLWHAAGENKTDKPRRSITPIFSKPFIKQGFDYCRSVGEDYLNSQSEWVKQLFGYYSRVPSNYDEWYQPIEKRFYRMDQL